MFVKPDGGRVEVTAPVGDSLLEVRLRERTRVERAARAARGAAATRAARPAILADCARKQGGNRGRVRRRDGVLDVPRDLAQGVL